MQDVWRSLLISRLPKKEPARWGYGIFWNIPLVTSAPLLISAKRPPPAEGAAGPLGLAAAGGGGGGAGALGAARGAAGALGAALPPPYILAATSLASPP